jgi:transcriptional regulator with XRE-family HTH domain
MLIQKLRLQRGWSQEQLADLSGGLLFDGLRVFDKLPFQSAEWERRQVEKYLGRRL